jgi:uncharacterized protein
MLKTEAVDHLALIPLTGRGRGLAPLVHPENAPFWDSIANGRLSLQRCRSCATLRFPLAPRCHNCLSASFDWEAIDPRGAVNVAVLNPSAPEGMPRIGLEPPWQDVAPYITGAVDMDCGIRLPGRIICDCGQARVPGTRVRGVVLETMDDVLVYGFAHTCVVEVDKTP